MHPEALSDRGKKLFPRLKNFSEFYLAGGTALALQLGHRRSVDFDFFSPKPIERNLLAKIKKIFVFSEITAAIDNPDELTVFVDSVKITFLKYPFPILTKLIKFKGIKILSAKEIGIAKAYAIGRRGSYKDYVDLYFILKKKIASLAETINLAAKKYGFDFNSRLFLEQLLYLEDVKDLKIFFLGQKQLSKEEVKSFFKKETEKFRIKG